MEYLFSFLSKPENMTFLQLFVLLEIIIGFLLFKVNRKSITASAYERITRFFIYAFFLQFILLVLIYSNSNGKNSFIGNFPEFIQFVIIICSIWIIWIWCFPLNRSKSDALNFIFSLSLTLIFLIQMVFTFLLNINILNLSFLLNYILFPATIIYTFICIIIFCVKRPGNWFAGVAFSIILLAGIGWMFIEVIFDHKLPIQNLLVFEAIAYMFLPLMTQAFIFPIDAEKNKQANELFIANEKMAILPSQEVFKSWINLLIIENESQIADEFINAIGKTFKAKQAILLGFSETDSNIKIFSTLSKLKIWQFNRIIAK